jgi:hypothetical protein
MGVSPVLEIGNASSAFKRINFIFWDSRNLNAQIKFQRSSFGVSVGSERMNMANVNAA